MGQCGGARQARGYAVGILMNNPGLTDPLEFLIRESTGVLSMVEVEIRSWFGALSGMKSGKMVS